MIYLELSPVHLELLKRYKIWEPSEYKHFAVYSDLEEIQTFRKAQKMRIEYFKDKSLEGEFQVSYQP